MDKPRRKLNRLKGYNYSQDGMYYVTICTKKRKKCFGKIINKKMTLNRYGIIANNNWKIIPNFYNNVYLDEWVIMPNHIHGIIAINNFNPGTEHCSARELPRVLGVGVGTEQCSVPTNIKNKRNYGLLSKIVKSFKDATTKAIRDKFNDLNFGWQRSFYDHIIRNEKSLENIRRYISLNPAKWDNDGNNIY